MRAAEALQLQDQPEYLKTYSLPGYRFCDLLLSRTAPLDGSALGREALASAGEDARRRCEEVRERASQMLERVKHSSWLFDVALDHLSLGRAPLGLALATAGDLDGARRQVNAARELVASTGYRRREREVAELTRALAGSGAA